MNWSKIFAMFLKFSETVASLMNLTDETPVSKFDIELEPASIVFISTTTGLYFPSIHTLIVHGIPRRIA